MQKTLVVGVLILCGGCASRDLYDGVQASNRFECNMLPPSQYKACISQATRSYDDYERERQAIKSNEK